MTDIVSHRALESLAAAAERLIGYFYAGLFPVLILTIERPAFVKGFVESTGGIFATIICLALGIGIYTAYFRIVGELALFPILHSFHLIEERILSRVRGTSDPISTIGLLTKCGVPPIYGRTAYCLVRDRFFSHSEKALLEVEHGELHVLYLTAVLSVVAYVLLWLHTGQTPSLLYILLAVVSYVAGLIADLRQHAKECLYLKFKQPELIEFLRKAGLVQEPEKKQIA